MNKKLYSIFSIFILVFSLLACSASKPFQLDDTSSYKAGMQTVLSLEDVELTKEQIQLINTYLEKSKKIDTPDIKGSVYYYSAISIYENDSKSIIIYGEYIYITSEDCYYHTSLDLYNYLDKLLHN